MVRDGAKQSDTQKTVKEEYDFGDLSGFDYKHPPRYHSTPLMLSEQILSKPHESRLGFEIEDQNAVFRSEMQEQITQLKDTVCTLISDIRQEMTNNMDSMHNGIGKITVESTPREKMEKRVSITK